MATNEVNEEQQIGHRSSSSVNMSNYVKRDELQPIKSKISFIEKLVCLKMEKLQFDETLESNDNCTEWWCPKHSTFLEILHNLKISEQTVEDRYIIRKSKARFVYWEDKNNTNTPRCPTQDRKRGQVIHYPQPKCWP